MTVSPTARPDLVLHPGSLPAELAPEQRLAWATALLPIQHAAGRLGEHQLSHDLLGVVGECLAWPAAPPPDRWVSAATEGGRGRYVPALDREPVLASWPTILRYKQQLELPTPLPPTTPRGLRLGGAAPAAVAAALGRRGFEPCWAAAVAASFGNAGYGPDEVVPTLCEMVDQELVGLMASVATHYTENGEPIAKAYYATYALDSGSPHPPTTPEGRLSVSRRLLSPSPRSSRRAL